MGDDLFDLRTDEFKRGAASRDAEIAKLKVVSDHNLTTYHQAAELLRAERDQLREQVAMLQQRLAKMVLLFSNPWCSGDHLARVSAIEESKDALATIKAESK